MDKDLRNTLRNIVAQCRRLLEKAISEALQGQFGIHASGKVEDTERMGHLSDEEQQYREQILAHLEHIKASGFKSKDVVAQLVREVSFTHLNRLCAYKMMETRGLIREAVGQGLKSQGFLFYLADHPEDEKLWSSGNQYVAYRHYLEWLGKSLSEEIGVLFSPHDPANYLFPPHRALEQVLDLINSEELKDVWEEDETIGWIYQYFTPKELREKARKESQAPRNSYELAFRNQFYTPRYVVQFLTDNTLGRIWYEMRQGQTALTERCEYLVRRPDEVFLAEERDDNPAFRYLMGKSDPDDLPDVWQLAHTVNGYVRRGSFSDGGNEWAGKVIEAIHDQESAEEFKTQELLDLLFLICRKERFVEGTLDACQDVIDKCTREIQRRVRLHHRDDLSQEELLRAPIFISFRPKKDPREIKVLDPACGSGHFLLYCFDLLETIYEEAYEDPDLGPALKKDYPTLVDLKKAVPGLILSRNLHGIDIDLRSIQIAALALWLRSQRSYQEIGLKKPVRPKITKSNLVCAESMPGDKELLEDFINELQPKVLGQLVRAVFDKMKLTGEAGTLLKIEEDISEAVDEAKTQWLEELMYLFPEEKLTGVQQQPSFDVSDITEEQFWNEAETRVVDALQDYAKRAANGKGLSRQLFSNDTVQGFTFVDICRKQFDVVLMNPPFGEVSNPSRSYIGKAYSHTKNDVYAAFVERSLQLLEPSGLLGAITSRTGFFLSSLLDFREEVIARSHLITMADLGEGVLDTAMVKTAAYILEKRYDMTSPSVFFRLHEQTNKSVLLKTYIHDKDVGFTFIVSQSDFQCLPGIPFAYWVPRSIREIPSLHEPLESSGREVRQGLASSDDFRFVRAWWEVAPDTIETDLKWALFAKGGESTAFYADIHLVILWENNGCTLKEYAASKWGSASRTIKSVDRYFEPGLTYTSYTNLGFSPRILPKGCIFSVAGMHIWLPQEDKWHALALLSSSFTKLFLSLITDGRKFEAGYVKSIPYISSTEAKAYYNQTNSDITPLSSLAKNAYDILRNRDTSIEISHVFSVPLLAKYKGDGTKLAEINTNINRRLTISNEKLANIKIEIDQIVWSLFGLNENDRPNLTSSDLTSLSVSETVEAKATSNGDTEAEIETNSDRVKNLIQWIIGVIYGRWDIRIVREPLLIPKLPDPFDPLPTCPPGMLIGSDGLPATSGCIVSEEWLRARPDAHSLPPEGSVKQPTIPDSEYPITVDWDGILVDDPNHSDDIVRRVRDVLRVLWKDRAEAIEQEACEILRVKELRDYFRKRGNSGFWMDHVKRHSKSRRKAPIYWLLQSDKKNYAIWLYYHRLDKDILFKALINYVEPKIRLEESRLEQIREQLTSAGTSGRKAKQLEKQRDDQEAFLSELRDFYDKLRRAADLHLEPDLNDGVVLNIAPLWELVPWKEAEKYWKKLLDGEYEWSSIGKQLREKGLVK